MFADSIQDKDDTWQTQEDYHNRIILVHIGPEVDLVKMGGGSLVVCLLYISRGRTYLSDS